MARRKRKGRDISGILVLNKPQGVTSNSILQRVKRMYGAQKAGHTGSLDPLATGVLPVCFGEATRFSQFLLDADKCYRVTAKLGITTASGDADGEVLEQKPVVDVDRVRLEEALEGFLGDIEQIPSMYSALKHQGQPLYKLARQGIEVERAARRVHIYKIELLDFVDDEVTFEVKCSKGTYVRTLVEDLGLVLGCGGHVTVLHRLQAGSYCSDSMIAIEELERTIASGGHDALDRLLLPVSSAVGEWPGVQLTTNAAYYLRNGQPVRLPGTPEEGWVSLYCDGGDFIGVGEVLDDRRVAPRRLIKAD